MICTLKRVQSGSLVIPVDASACRVGGLRVAALGVVDELAVGSGWSSLSSLGRRTSIALASAPGLVVVVRRGSRGCAPFRVVSLVPS